jgi:hypothetical protein
MNKPPNLLRSITTNLQRELKIFIPPPSPGTLGWFRTLLGFPWVLIGVVVLAVGAREVR